MDILGGFDAFSVGVLIFLVEVLDPCQLVLGRLDIGLVHCAGVWTLEMKLDVLSYTLVLGLKLDVDMEMEAFLGMMLLCDDHFFDGLVVENFMELARCFLLGQRTLRIR